VDACTSPSETISIHRGVKSGDHAKTATHIGLEAVPGVLRTCGSFALVILV